MANFYFQQAPEAYNIIFRLNSHRHFCLEFNKDFFLVKHQLEKQGKLKNMFKVNPMVMWKTKK